MYSTRHILVDKIVACQMEMSVSRQVYESGVQRWLHWVCPFRNHQPIGETYIHKNG